MKRTIQNALFLCFPFFVTENLYAQYTMKDFMPLQGLKGSWKMTTNKGTLYEHWQAVNDSVLHNKSFRVNGRDTIPQETVELKLFNGSITYNSVVANQNRQQAVTFTLVSTKNGEFVFENKAHDFPQLISYHLVDNETLIAKISGTIKEKHNEIVFNFKREK